MWDKGSSGTQAGYSGRNTACGSRFLFGKADVPFLILASLPLLYLVLFLTRYRVDVPFLDQWEFVPFLEKSYEGTLSFRDFWAQHNEHRLIFPRLIMLILARLTGWNVVYEQATSIVLATGTFAIVVCQIRLTGRSVRTHSMRWLIPIVSLLVFSMSQWRNWFLGWQVQEFLNVLAVVGGVVLLSHPLFRWRRFIGALLLGIVATYSFANGMCFWLVGLIPLLLVPVREKTVYTTRLALWIVVAGLTACSYLYDYHTPDYHPPLSMPFKEPLAYALYVFKYLGAPIISFRGRVAATMGLVGVAVLGWGTWLLVRRRSVSFHVLAPYSALGLYAILSAMITGVARLASGGSDQALSSRYVTVATLLWVSDLVLLFLVAVEDGVGTTWGKGNRVFRRCVIGFVILLVLLMGASARHGSIQWLERYPAMLEARNELLVGDDDAVLRPLHPVPQIVKERRGFLAERNFSVFRNVQKVSSANGAP